MKLSVQGSTCAACAAQVEKKLNTIDGVAATVNFATEAAIVTAPAEVPVQWLIDAVEQAGYRAEILDRGAPATHRRGWLRPRRAGQESAAPPRPAVPAGRGAAAGSQEQVD
jgi:copper chaperone CopZ